MEPFVYKFNKLLLIAPRMEGTGLSRRGQHFWALSQPRGIQLYWQLVAVGDGRLL